MPDEPQKQFVNISFDEKLLSRIDDFRFKQRFASRTEAIRWLITAALDHKLTPKAE
jgi:metal-responsive CopG/Arc/MetJ family transcriptional regulator